jgi:hypothetical protein
MNLSNQQIAQRAQRILDVAAKCAKTPEGASRCSNITLYASGYAEPGYSDPDCGLIAVGDWNDVSRYNLQTRKFDHLDNTPGRVAKLLEKLGAELEWEDAWTSCADCGKLVRTQPDSYSWQRAYSECDDGVYCLDCIDPVEHLEALEGNAQSCNTVDTINPADHGYECLQADLQHGLYGGQNADPNVVGKNLEKLGVRRFLFNLDSSGQFDIRFSVWVHKSEWKKVRKALKGKSLESRGDDPAENLRKALQTVPVGLPAGPGVQYTQIDLGTGTATTRLVSPEKFVNGIGR